MPQAKPSVIAPPINTGLLRLKGSSIRSTAERGSAGWGWLPALALVDAIGLLLVVFAFNGGREGAAWSAVFYWTGLLVVFVPVAVRLFSAQATRQERMGLIIVLGLVLYLIRVAYNPLEFKFVDELQHWRSTQDVLQTGRLFQPNPILPVSPFYPGLENVTAALASLSGLNIFHSGIIVMGVTRLVFAMALFLFYEQISRSPYIAGIAALLYMTNPHFNFLAAFFIYQSLAVPIAVLTLLAAILSHYSHDSNQLGLRLIILLGLAAVVITHHVTSYALVAFLILWTLAALPWAALLRSVGHYASRVINPAVAQLAPLWGNSNSSTGSKSQMADVGRIALLALVMVLTWIVYVATVTIDYLAEPLISTVGQLIRLGLGELSVEQTFHAPAGPWPEQLVSIFSVVLIVLSLPFGLWQIWRQYRDDPLVVALGIGSLGYFATLALRFTSQGAPFTVRAWTFLFVAIAFVLAIGAARVYRSRLQIGPWQMVFPLISMVLFLGGITNGWPPYWERLPGPYLVSAFERSIEPQGVMAAKWARTALGRDNRMATDFINHHLMGAYGEQNPDRCLPEIFFSPRLGAKEKAAILDKGIRYLVVDRRLSNTPPMMGTYFCYLEPDVGQHTHPIEPAALAKFDGQTNISRVFDSGQIVIYDVGAWSHGP